MTKKQLRALLLSIVISAAAYGLWIGLSDPSDIVIALNKVGFQGCFLILALSLMNYAIRFARYHWLMKAIGDNVPILPNLLFYLSGFALTTTPGKAGESIRYIYLKPYKVPFEHALAILLSERLFDLLAVWLIALLGLWAFAEYRWVIILTAVLCTVGVLLVQQPFMLKLFDRWKQGETSTITQRIGAFASQTLHRTRDLLKLKPFVLGTLLGVLSWGAEAIGFVYLLELLGYDLNPMLVAAIYAAAMLVGAVSFLPGGLGGAEVTMHLLLMALAVSEADSVAATLLCRIATLWFAVIIGLLVMVYLELIHSHGPQLHETQSKN